MPGRGHRDREREGVAGGVAGQRLAGVDDHLVGERGERRQGPGAAHDVAVGRLADELEDDLAVTGVDLTARLVDRGVDDGVGHGVVAEHRLALEAHEVLGAFAVAVLRPHVGAAGEAGQRHVEVVGAASEQTEGVQGDALEGDVAAPEVGGGPRDEVADADLVAALGVGRQQLVGMLELEVEERGQRACRAAAVPVPR